MAEKLQQELTFEKTVTRKVSCNYLLHLPKEYEASDKRWPLILFLHGVGERGDNIELVREVGLAKLIEKKGDFPFIVVSPQCPEDEWWNNDVVVRDVLKNLLDNIIEDYRIDTDRIYLTGLSMGGFGTWRMAMTYPDMFAAAAPVCGGGIIYLAEKYKDLPIWAFHGEEDDVVTVEKSREMVEAINNAGGNAKLTVYPGVGHNSWDRTYANDQLYDWFLSHTKNRK